MAKSDLQEMRDTLRELAVEQKLVARALEVCHIAMANCEEQDISVGLKPFSGWLKEDIRTKFVKQSFVFDYPGREVAYIETVIQLYVDPFSRRGKPTNLVQWEIGHCRIHTSADGDIIDDYFILD